MTFVYVQDASGPVPPAAGRGVEGIAGHGKMMEEEVLSTASSSTALAQVRREMEAGSSI